MWLDLVTYLHHHGHEDKLPWYRGQVSFSILFLINSLIKFLLFFLYFNLFLADRKKKPSLSFGINLEAIGVFQ
jgi:hypothetical protein